MTKEQVRICCRHYFEEELTNIDRIEEVMGEIAVGRIRRPVFELVFPKSEKKPMIVASALFREGRDIFLEGWFVRESIKGAADQGVYCVERTEESERGFKDVINCGVPVRIDSSAILTTFEASRLLKSLVAEMPAINFEKRSYLSAIQHD